MLRVKESEVQYLKQEINSLKDELQSAQRVKLFLLGHIHRQETSICSRLSGVHNINEYLHLRLYILYVQDKKYATDKYKDIYTELSIVKAKAERDLGRLRDQLQLAHEALGEPSLEEVERGGYGTKTHTSHCRPYTT